MIAQTDCERRVPAAPHPAVADVRAELAGLRAELARLRVRRAELQAGLASLQAGLADLQAGFAEREARNLARQSDRIDRAAPRDGRPPGAGELADLREWIERVSADSLAERADLQDKIENLYWLVAGHWQADTDRADAEAGQARRRLRVITGGAPAP